MPATASFQPEMALFRNFSVNLRDSLCGVLQYASAQSLDFLDLAKNFSFLIWKLLGAHKSFLDGHYLLALFKQPAMAG
jgi:hypothetical protein